MSRPPPLRGDRASRPLPPRVGMASKPPPPPPPPPAGAGGFTLIEMVLVILLMSIVATMVSVFLRQPVNAYVDLARRAALTDAADSALRRIARELRLALPNSVRVDASGAYLEFLPVSAGGRYRAAPEAGGSGDFLDFGSASDNSFAVLGPPVAVAAGDQLVVYNLGSAGADAYAGDTRRALSVSGAALGALSYTLGSGGQFPFASPANRFQIVNTPVSYVCTGGNLRRYARYAIQATQPVDTTAAPLAALSGADNALLAGNVTGCSFSVASANGSAAMARNGVATLRLTLSSAGESVTLLQQVHVENVP